MVGGMLVWSAYIGVNLSEPSDRSELRSAFVAAFPEYVAGWLRERNVSIDIVLADAVVEGTEVLDGLLTGLDATPPEHQRQSPLELFREALRPIDRALSTLGTEIPGADTVPSIAPWDRFGLSPGSSQVLGARAHEAHLRWGLERVAAVVPSRPRAGVFATSDHAESLADAVVRAGYDVADGGEPSVVVVDLDLGVDRAADVIRGFADRSSLIVCVADTVDELGVPGVRALGAAAIVDRTAFIAEPLRYLPMPA